MNNETKLPPVTLNGPAAWTGEDLARVPQSWTRTLSQNEIAELERAADVFAAGGKAIAVMTKEDFPLPGLSRHLTDLRSTLVSGIGFEILRGLPVGDYSQKKAATIFCGIGVHLGRARSQNAEGHILGHVRDIGADANDTNTRIYQTAQRQTFHTDSADVVGLLCLKKAREGGQSLLVSTQTIYNEMRRRRPDLVGLLFDPIATDRRGEVPEGEKPFFEIPVFNWHAGYLTGMYQRQYIDSAQRFPQAMRLTKAHIEALDFFDELANDADLHLSMQLEPGDMQFVYNHALLHDRTGFTDWEEPQDKRHLLRLWLSLPEDRPLPDAFKQRYGSIEIGARGGIITPGTHLNVPLD